MLPKPKMLQIPFARLPESFEEGYACGTHAGCGGGYTCDPYGSNCVDATYNTDGGCSWTLGIGAVSIGVTLLT